MNNIIHQGHWLTCLLFVGTASIGGGLPTSLTGSSTILLTQTGGSSGTAIGGFISDGGGLDTYYSYVIEVPNGTTSLTVEIFDPDFGNGGIAEAASGRDRQRGGTWNSLVGYDLFDDRGNQQVTTFNVGSAAGYGNADSNTTDVNNLVNIQGSGDNQWVTLFTTNNPRRGHWELRVNTSNRWLDETFNNFNFLNGNDINAYGVRATGGLTELNVYVPSFLPVGINGDVTPGSGTVDIRTYPFYPFVTEDCTVTVGSFDFDENQAGNQGQATFTSPQGTYSDTLGTGDFSNNNAWRGTSLGGQTSTDFFADNIGIWTATLGIREWPGNSNYGEFYVAPTDLGVPTSQPEPSTYRLYLPTSTGNPPVKPYFTQQLFHVAGPNPAETGQDSTYKVVIDVFNPTAGTIRFNNNSRRVEMTVPGGGAVYAGNALASSGSVRSEPAIGGTGTFFWRPGNMGPNTQETLEYLVAVTPVSDGQRIPVTGQPANNDATRMSFRDITNRGDTTPSFISMSLCELAAAEGGPAVPTPVTVAEFGAQAVGSNQVALQWTTATESGNMGFEIIAEDGATTGRVIPDSRVDSDVFDSITPTHYGVRLATDATRFSLHSIERDGSRLHAGQTTLGQHAGEAIAQETIDWRQAIRPRSPTVNRSAASYARLGVRQDGLHAVTVAQLATAGLSIDTWPAADLAIVDGHGEPVAYTLRNHTGAVIGSAASIIFAAKARDSLYGDTQVYRLLRDPDAARQMAVLTEDLNNAVSLPLTHRATFDRNLRYSYAAPGDDPWFETSLFASTVPTTQFVSFELPAYAGDGAELQIRLYGMSAWPGDNDHKVEVAINGEPIGTIVFDGISVENAILSVPAGVLHAAQNEMSLHLPRDSGGSHDLMYLERFSLRFTTAATPDTTRVFTAQGNEDWGPSSDLLFANGFSTARTEGCHLTNTHCSVYPLTGFDSNSTIAVRARGGDLAVLPQTHQNGEHRTGGLLLTGDQVMVADVSSLQRPAIEVRPAVYQAWPTGDYLVIGPTELLRAAQPLLTLHQSNGLRVTTATPQALYDRYAEGVTDPAAIAAFIRDQYAAGGARFVLLLGADSYDYHDYLGLGAFSLVPTFYRDTGSVITYSPTDLPYADVNDDGVPDLALGRVPARTANDISRWLDKTLALGARWSEDFEFDALLVADSRQPGASFDVFSDQLRDSMTNSWSVETAYIDEIGSLGARDAIMASFQGNADVVSYMGHAAPSLWSFEQVLKLSDVTSFSPTPDSVLVTQWGCWTNYFVDPQYLSLGEKLVTAAGGAAVAVGATTLTSAGNDVLLGERFFDQLASASVGEALAIAKQQLVADHGYLTDTMVGITLFGDPALGYQRSGSRLPRVPANVQAPPSLSAFANPR